MPIQRQSESFGYFDDGPRFARDRSPADLPKGLAGLVNSMGPRIQAGLLNTRTAADDDTYDHGEGPGYPDWLRKNRGGDDDHGWEEATSNDYLFDEMGRYRRDRFKGKESARLAVNTDSMDPDDHAYHTEAPYGPGGEWVGDEDGYRAPRREWNPDYGYEPTDEDERRAEGVYDDDESGYNWGPVPPEHFGSRHPFDRAAGARLAKDKDSECTCWEGYERVPGTEPCAEDSCRKESMRLAGPGTDDRNVRPGPLVDHPLYEQDPDDYFGRRPYSGPYCPDCGRPTRWVSGPTCRHGKLLVDASWFDGKPDHADVGWAETDEGWEHPVTGCQVRPSSKYLDEWEIVAPTTSKRKPYTIIDHHPDPQAMMDRHDRTTGYAPKTAQADPAAMAPQIPAGGGYQIGHRVQLMWRPNSNLSGTVIGLTPDGSNVNVRWDDGQYSPEEPRNIQLL